MLLAAVDLLWLAIASVVAAQSTSSSASTSQITSSSQTDPNFSYTQNVSIITSNIPTSAFTGSQYTYISYSGQRTVSDSQTTTNSSASTMLSNSSSSNSQITRTYTSQTVIEVTGTAKSSNNMTSTSSAAQPTNTVPCNNYPEFCNRRYSNITQVCSHNSAFAVKNNAASNQVYDITTQLNDGIRMCEYCSDNIAHHHTDTTISAGRDPVCERINLQLSHIL